MKTRLLKIDIDNKDLFIKGLEECERCGIEIVGFMENSNYTWLKNHIIDQVNEGDKYNDVIGLSLSLSQDHYWSDDDERDFKIKIIQNDWEDSFKRMYLSLHTLSPHDGKKSLWERKYYKIYKIKSADKLIKVIKDFKEEYDNELPIMRQKLIDTLNKYPSCKIGKHYKYSDDFSKEYHKKDKTDGFVVGYSYNGVNGIWQIQTNHGTCDFDRMDILDTFCEKNPKAHEQWADLWI